MAGRSPPNKLPLPLGIQAPTLDTVPLAHPKQHLDWSSVLAQLIIVSNRHTDHIACVAVGLIFAPHVCEAAY